MSIPRHDLWIAGKHVKPSSDEYFDVLNPLDDAIYAAAAKGCAEDVRFAVDAADSAFQGYRKSLPREREAWLNRAADLLQQQADEFVDILIDEIGSPIIKAEREVSTATGVLRAAAGATRQLSGKTLPTDVDGRMSVSVRRPIGVIAGVTPFNVPLIKGVKHAAMPLATGNTVVLLPSEEAPVMAYRLAKLFAEAGIPDGAFNVVTGSGYEIGDALTTHPAVKMVGFTGSTRVGKQIGAMCGKLGKRVTLEMGSKCPLVVLQDAEMGKAVMGSVIGSFMFQGQICMASSRIYVERPIYEEFVDRFTAAAGGLGMGELRDKQTMLGPIINDRQRTRVKTHIEDAIAKGAVVRTGGQWEGNRCQATVLTDVSDEAMLCKEETFGPVSAVYPVDSPEEALRMANDSSYGLSASVYTTDLEAAMRFAEEMDAGMVHVNGTTIQEEAHVPFGGIGDSGFGRESTDTDIAEMTEWKWITIQYS